MARTILTVAACSVCGVSQSEAYASIGSNSFLPGTPVYVGFSAQSTQAGQCTTTEIDVTISGDDGFFAIYDVEWTDTVGDSLSDGNADTYSPSTINYEMDADYYYYEEECGPDSDSASGEATPQDPTLSGSDVWWFNGASGDDGDLTDTVALSSDAGAETSWWVVNGSDKVSLQQTSGATIYIQAVAASDYEGDIRIAASWGGSTYSEFVMTARTPYKLVHGNTEDAECDTSDKWETKEHYTVYDQTNHALTGVSTMNEKWTSAVTADYANENWTRPTEANWVTNSNGEWYDDMWKGASYANYPLLACPGSTAVDHWDQVFFVGSRTTGSGTSVQKDTFQRYTGKGRHLNITSPYTY